MSTVTVEQHGSVRVVTLNRPRAKNALNDDVYLQVIDQLKAAQEDDNTFAVVLTGAGSHFCSGQDLKDVDIQQRRAVSSHSLPVGRFMDAILAFSKLLIAAVNGPAVGIGATLLAHCDYVIASPAADVWTPFSSLGVVPEFGSSVTLPLLCGRRAAADLLIFGETYTAEQACREGLYDELAEAPVSAALAKLAAAAKRDVLSGGAWTTYKQMMRARNQQAIADAIKLEFEEIDVRFKSPDLEKRLAAAIRILMQSHKPQPSKL